MATLKYYCYLIFNYKRNYTASESDSNLYIHETVYIYNGVIYIHNGTLSLVSYLILEDNKSRASGRIQAG